MEEETPLDVLERITPTLSDFSQVYGEGEYEGLQGHRLDKGTSLLWGIYKSGGIAVAKGLLTSGSIFPKHIHEDINEHFFVLSGCMTFHFDDGDEQVLEAGGYVQIAPNVPHSGTVQEDTWYLAITIPADEAFPDDEC